MKIQIYVGTYAKYNNGSIEGKWIDVTDLSKEEFEQICKDLHNDEEDAEFMFQDWECPRYLENYIDEGGISDEFWEIKEKANNLNDNELEAFSIYISHGFDADVRKFQDEYLGYYGDNNVEYDFGYYLMNECGGLNGVPDHLKCFFDYEAYGRDMLSSYYWEEDGYIFIN